MQHHLASDPGIAFLSAGTNIWGLSYSAVSKKLFACGADPGRIGVFRMEAVSNNQAFRYMKLPDVTGVEQGQETSAFITCSPIAAKAYACMFDASVMVIDTTADNATLATHIPPLGEVGNMAFSPDGRMSYFPAGDTLYAVDESSTASSAVPIPLTVSAHWVAISRDGLFAYCGGSPGDTGAVHIARVDLAMQKQKDIVKNLDDAVIAFDLTFDDRELLVSTVAQNVDVVTISQNAKTASINLGGNFLGQVSCSKTAPRGCLTTDTIPNNVTNDKLFVAVIDTIDNTTRGGIPIPSAGFCTSFDEYGNAYVGTAANGIMAIIHSKINSM